MSDLLRTENLDKAFGRVSATELSSVDIGLRLLLEI